MDREVNPNLSLDNAKDGQNNSDDNEDAIINLEYNLRPRSILNRIEVEKRKRSKKEPKPKQKPPPLSKYRRRTANARERGRMQEINDAFEALRRVVPVYPGHKISNGKMTKIATLRLAMNYISALSKILQDSEQHGNNINSTLLSEKLPAVCCFFAATIDSDGESLQFSDNPTP